MTTSGSADYRLTDDERGIEHIPSGRRYPLRGRRLDVYRALSLQRGRIVSSKELAYVVWGTPRYIQRATLQMHISQLRRRIAPEVIETLPYGYGYIVRQADGQP